MVKGYGYQVESHEVQTEDGYILTLFRIPSGRDNSNQGGGDQQNSSGNKDGKRRAVFFMHGLMTNAESFIFGGPSVSMALNMADAGYDVYFGNSRGTVYGHKHTTWHDIGVKDIPALVDKVLSISGQATVSYIGHNEGTTAFYAMVSENPDYSDKFDRHISLGPIVYMKNADNEVFENIKNHYTDKSNVYFLFNGYNSKHLNQTTMDQVVPRIPSTASAREIHHFAQLMKYGNFQKYSEDSNGQDYDLSKVTTPVALFYTPEDHISNEEDVKNLASNLPNVYQQHKFEDLTNNVDLLWSENMQNVYDQVKHALEMETQKGDQ
ncbi:hypothetical protein NQ318_013448 [Aromia moschata]|uniref:Partial AB-hydrolase lipase domain-containing protein n=1 Tax=Aromia moschata TaxID=1265417 RepID=A0AAV8YMJ7_9CUCU|nr:hypothetical protein NQ318_013448 [Aromia moschata]